MAKRGYNFKDHPCRYAAIAAVPGGLVVIGVYEIFKVSRVYVRNTKAAKIRRVRESRLKEMVGS